MTALKSHFETHTALDFSRTIHQLMLNQAEQLTRDPRDQTRRHH